MSKWFSRLSFIAMLAACLAAGTASAQFNAVQGRDYQLVNPPQNTDGDAAVEVLEFFAYGCIHCYTLEPKLETWSKAQSKDVKVKRVPTPFALKGIDSTPIYYTLEAMNLVDKLHLKIFEAVHNDNQIIGNPEVRYQWLAKQGVDVKKFQEVEKSFTVQNKVQRARTLAQAYKIESTPTLIVNGKFAVVSQGEQTFRVVDSLIANIKVASASAAPAAGAPAAAPAPAPKKAASK
jgi:protein dithiol oxidoreductase (disulfide-forming)